MMSRSRHSSRSTAEETRYLVVHLKPDYLPATEVFIYDALRHALRHKPLILAERVINLEAFPIEDLIEVKARTDGAMERLLARVGRAAAGIPTLQTYRYLKVLEGLKPRLIHAHFGPTGYMGTFLKKKRFVPLVTTFYGFDLSMPLREPGWRTRYDELFSAGDLFLAEGPRMKEQLQALGCSPDKIRILRIGIDLSRFRFHPRRVAEREPIQVIHTGRMVEKKGHEIALRAFAACQREFPELRLRMIGDGPLMGRIEATAKQLGLSDVVEFLGTIGRDRYQQELERAHIALQSSVTAADGDSEGGAPTTLLDAQASGLPVVASRHADIPFVVDEGRSALLAPEGDVEALAQSLRTMIQARARWGDFGENGRKFVMMHHEIHRTVAALERCYHHLICRERVS